VREIGVERKAGSELAGVDEASCRRCSPGRQLRQVQTADPHLNAGHRRRWRRGMMKKEKATWTGQVLFRNNHGLQDRRVTWSAPPALLHGKSETEATRQKQTKIIL